MKYYALFFAAMIGALFIGLGYSTQAKTTPAKTASTNLLVNGDFETGQREPWVYIMDDFLFGGVGSVYPHTGAYDLQLALGHNNLTGYLGGGGIPCPNSGDTSFRPVQVTPNTSYQLSGYVLMETPNGNYPSASLTVIWYSGCSSELYISQGIASVLHGTYGEYWQYTQGVLTAPANAQYALIGLKLDYYGDKDSQDGYSEDYAAYFDDIAFSQVPTPPTPTITPVPPRCPSERFTDVCPGDYFYQHVLDLNDFSILSGYNTTPPCDNPTQVPCFKPNGLITRGQMAKIISNAAGFTEPAGAQQFEDVPPGSTFYDYVWRLANREIVVGYSCGSNPGETCVAPGNLPYFRVNANVNRAQMAKFTALAFGFEDTPTSQSFEDVLPDNHFYPFIENLSARNIIGGYPCGGPGEPCGAGNLPYYRYGTLVTRGQVAKIVNLARIIVVPTPTVTPTAIPTGESQ